MLLLTRHLVNKDINADLAAEALKSIIPSSKPKIITIPDIQKVVGEHYQYQAGRLQSEETNKIDCVSKTNCYVSIKRTNRFVTAKNR